MSFSMNNTINYDISQNIDAMLVTGTKPLASCGHCASARGVMISDL
jgi:hypothetical protein